MYIKYFCWMNKCIYICIYALVIFSSQKWDQDCNFVIIFSLQWCLQNKNLPNEDLFLKYLVGTSINIILIYLFQSSYLIITISTLSNCVVLYFIVIYVKYLCIQSSFIFFLRLYKNKNLNYFILNFVLVMQCLCG